MPGNFHVDHVVPASKGGTDDVDNLVVACAQCNLLKRVETWRPRPAGAAGALSVVDVLRAQGYSTSEARERHAQLEAGREARTRRRLVSDGSRLRNSIREARKELGWSQAGLARELGISRQTVNALEAGRWNPSLRLAFALADLFDKQIEDLFEPT